MYGETLAEILAKPAGLKAYSFIVWNGPPTPMGRGSPIFLVRSQHDELQRIIQQWLLQSLGLIHGALIQASRSSSVVRITTRDAR
jgi:hypothetical protein